MTTNALLRSDIRRVTLSTILLSVCIGGAVVGFAVASSGAANGAAGGTVEALVASLPADTSEQQRGVLADGDVSQDEYEAAVAATIGCMRSAGVEVLVTPAQGRRPTRFGFVAADLTAASTSREVMGKCESEHLSRLAVVKSIQDRPSDAEREAGSRKLAACIKAAGVAVRGDKVTDADRARWAAPDASNDHALKAWFTCSDELEPELGYRP